MPPIRSAKHPPSKRKTKDLLRLLSNRFNVLLSFKTSDIEGGSTLSPNLVSITENQSPQAMMWAFFHELGHVHCYRKGIFYNYHNDKYGADLGFRSRLRVERWVARFGEKLYREEGMDEAYGIYHDGYLHQCPEKLRKWMKENS